MPTGLKVPVGVTRQGRVALVSSEENDQKTLGMALSDCDNDHAYQQDLGIPSDIIFDINDPKVRARVLRRLMLISRRFENQRRYKVRKETISWSSSEGSLTLSFRYINLESDSEETFEQSFV
jgi:hypothetical protein